MLWLTCGQAHLCLSPSKPRAKVPEKVSVHTFGDQQTCTKFNVAMKKSPKMSLQEHAEICVLFKRCERYLYERISLPLSHEICIVSCGYRERTGPGAPAIPE